MSRKPGDADLDRSYAVTRCVICGDSSVDVQARGRFVRIHCAACEAVVAIEFDPPDDPRIRGRIERLEIGKDD